ncbi:MAG TPA: MFS transporter, partial [Anseongella sp.]|nr:MFS transporter [Anseongella sp.]
VGLLLANHYGWRAPFWMIAVMGVLLGLLIAFKLRPVTGHLAAGREISAFRHLARTLSRSRYLLAYLATTLLATGGFMLMPFGSTFSVNNLGIPMDDLPLLYGITGVFAIVFGPLTGRLSDSLGKFRVFCAGSLLTMIMAAIYCNLSITPFFVVAAVSVLMFLGVSSRMIASSALMTAIPDPADRGAFMSINSSVQQISGGIGSAIAGLIVVQSGSGTLQHYDTLGYIVIGAMAVTMVLMYFVNRLV